MNKNPLCETIFQGEEVKSFGCCSIYLNLKSILQKTNQESLKNSNYKRHKILLISCRKANTALNECKNNNKSSINNIERFKNLFIGIKRSIVFYQQDHKHQTYLHKLNVFKQTKSVICSSEIQQNNLQQQLFNQLIPIVNSLESSEGSQSKHFDLSESYSINTELVKSNTMFDLISHNRPKQLKQTISSQDEENILQANIIANLQKNRMNNKYKYYAAIS